VRVAFDVQAAFDAALEAGTTPDESVEAVWVAAAMHADDPAMHSTPMLATLGEWAQAPARRHRHWSPAKRSDMG
jgi:alkylhydroperoxidase/carboxymuconolactone decarboxylase family protein YurZ